VKWGDSNCARKRKTLIPWVESLAARKKGGAKTGSKNTKKRGGSGPRGEGETEAEERDLEAAWNKGALLRGKKGLDLVRSGIVRKGPTVGYRTFENKKRGKSKKGLRITEGSNASGTCPEVTSLEEGSGRGRPLRCLQKESLQRSTAESSKGSLPRVPGL